LALVFAGVYSVGQATSEKQKIVNAADAAAYSGALTEARALNLTSYTNRSVIANEVLIAQMVSLDSWASYFSVATDRYATLFGSLKSIPYVGVVFGILETSMKVLHQIVEPIDNTLENVVPATINIWEGIYALWYNATIVPAFTPPAMAFAAKSAAESVLANNVANQGGRIDTAPRLAQVVAYGIRNEFEWSRLVKRYRKTGSPGTSSDDRKYAGELLLASRDQFSIERRGSDYPFLNVLFGNSDFCINYIFKIGSEKLGPTRLVDYDRWEAQDTLEYKLNIPPGGISGCKWGKGTVAVPVGYGRATADKDSSAGDMMPTSGGAGSLAYSNNHANGAWSGVKELYDVDRNNDGTPKFEEISYASAVYKQNTDIHNNESLGFMARPMNATTGSPDLRAGFARNQIGAVSEAKIFFARPARNNRDITAGNFFRADSHQEFASLYNPYWQVRLKDVSVANRALAYAFAGLNPALAIYAQN
jgi:hypothetical protein